MILDESDLREGLEFIVGTWRVDYVVNAWSNDLSHIPAAEWKSEDGGDLCAVTFEFFEDHTVKLTDASKNREHTGEWEQTGWCEYRYTLGDFLDLPEGTLRENVERLSVRDGDLVFSIGFLAIGMKKIASGVVAEPEKAPDIGDLEPGEADLSLKEIVGRYEVAKAMSFLDGELAMHTREEVAADLEKRLAAGEIEEDEVADSMKMFDAVIEFTADHRVIEWIKAPEGVGEDEIKAALEEGEISAYRDGMIALGEKEWKAIGGRYYYDTGEEREVFGEAQSPWDELAFDEEGLLPFGDKMMLLRRID